MTRKPTIRLAVQDGEGGYRAATTEEIFTAANHEAQKKFNRRPVLTRPQDTREYLKQRFIGLEDEVFAMLSLDNRHRVLAFDILFTGTIDGCSVHPRTVVKRALEINAAAIIFSHPHPSGTAEPSQADERITQKLQRALALVEIRVLDHIVCGADRTVSFAERGLL